MVSRRRQFIVYGADIRSPDAQIRLRQKLILYIIVEMLGHILRHLLENILQSSNL